MLNDERIDVGDDDDEMVVVGERGGEGSHMSFLYARVISAATRVGSGQGSGNRSDHAWPAVYGLAPAFPACSRRFIAKADVL